MPTQSQGARHCTCRANQEEIPEGELKRRMDRMVRRFLTRHAPKQEQELMNFQMAVTVLRIQRKWRQIAARRKAEREAARPMVPRLDLSRVQTWGTGR